MSYSIVPSVAVPRPSPQQHPSPSLQKSSHAASDSTYHLKNYLWRSFLTFTGPLVLWAFYAYLCFAFLAIPPVNGIVSSVKGDARWVYYAWFVVAIFALDWARAGLANVEAAALMNPRLAPITASELMWHMDSNWANPLWWLRALRSVALRFPRGKRSWGRTSPPAPNALWAFLSSTTFLLFIGLPLSGLTMDIADVMVLTNRPAQLLGPGSDTFNVRSVPDMQQQILHNWESGRQTTPSFGAFFYAPDGTQNVSTTYFDDQAGNYAAEIQVFVGPTVRESVSGKAWGVSANISCKPVPSMELQMLQIRGWNNYSIKDCLTGESSEFTCDPKWLNTDAAESAQYYGANFPLWFNETQVNDLDTEYSLVVAADGYFISLANGSSPYTEVSNHDKMTFDHIRGQRSLDDVTTAMFEVFLWEGSDFGDEILQSLTDHQSDLVDITTRPVRGSSYPVKFGGIGIHCDVTTAVGYAELNPARRTYSNFERGVAVSNAAQSADGSAYDVPPAQVLAITSLAQDHDSGLLTQKLVQFTDYENDQTTFDENESEQTWVLLHDAINSVPLRPALRDVGNKETWVPEAYSALTPNDLQHAVYKLLGESVIAMMGPGGVDPWFGNLTSLRPTRYLVSGMVPWIPILILLGLWALVLSGAAVWTVLIAGPRWAPSLSGFEMFKFGAQYAEVVDDLETVDFQGCDDALKRVPGMVGMLPGTGEGAEGGKKWGFIGLSENVAEKGVTYTLDRRRAAVSRPSARVA